MSDGTCPAIVLSARHDLVLKLSCPQCALRQPTLRHMCLWQTFLRSPFFVSVVCYVFGFLLLDHLRTELMVCFSFYYLSSLFLCPCQPSLFFPAHLNQSGWLVCYQLRIVKALDGPSILTCRFLRRRSFSLLLRAFYCFSNAKRFVSSSQMVIL